MFYLLVVYYLNSRSSYILETIFIICQETVKRSGVRTELTLSRYLQSARLGVIIYIIGQNTQIEDQA